MKCSKCGYEDFLDFEVCPQCGSSSNSSGGDLSGVLSSPLYLVMCILMSVHAGANFLMNGLIPVIPVLLTIFMWVAYANAQNGKGLRALSGTVFAHYIINYVLCGFIVITGLLASVIFKIIELILSIGIVDDTFKSTFNELYDVVEQLLSLSGVAVAVVFILVAAIVAVINFFAIGSIHSFTKAAYTGGTPKRGGAGIWLFIIGGTNALSALSCLFLLNFWGFISSAALAAVSIMAGIVVNKCK